MKDKNKSKPIATIVASKVYEGFPTTVVESYSNGIPVISSNTGNLSKIVIDSVTGVHFDKRDVNSLIHVVKMFENLNVEQISSNARNEYKNFYSEIIICDILINIYNNIL